MVAITHSSHATGQWTKFVPLALLANMLILSAISLQQEVSALPTYPNMQISLVSLAAPSAPAIAPPPASPQQTMQPTPVKTQADAVQKVASLPASKPKRQKPVQEVSKASPQTKPEKTPLVEKIVQQPAKLISASDEGKQKTTVIHEAQYRRQVPPVYPRRALALGQQGTVTLHAKILPSGQPGELKMAESSGHRLLDIAALEAVKKWEFEPYRQSGKSMSQWVRVPVRFVIQ